MWVVRISRVSDKDWAFSYLKSILCILQTRIDRVEFQNSETERETKNGDFDYASGGSTVLKVDEVRRIPLGRWALNSAKYSSCDYS